VHTHLIHSSLAPVDPQHQIASYPSLCRISSKSVNPLCRDIAMFHVFKMAGDRHSSWICFRHTWTTHKEYLVVSITVQNLVMINAVVSIIRAFQYLAHLAGKCQFTLPKSNNENQKQKPRKTSHSSRTTWTPI